jgi:hypothetical protein
VFQTQGTEQKKKQKKNRYKNKLVTFSFLEGAYCNYSSILEEHPEQQLHVPELLTVAAFSN